MPTSLVLEKQALRREMKNRLKAHLPQRDIHSREICQRLLSHPALLSARTVGLFSPLPEEPDLLELLNLPGRRFAFPCVNGTRLEWRQARHRAELLPAQSLPGRTLLEPRQGSPVPLEEVECLLVPGLAFTAHGHRLGRGGGHYDRTLAARTSKTLAIGICFAFQRVERIPLETHDLPVDTLVHNAT